jgi:hypothetical protein
MREQMTQEPTQEVKQELTMGVLKRQAAQKMLVVHCLLVEQMTLEPMLVVPMKRVVHYWLGQKMQVVHCLLVGQTTLVVVQKTREVHC